VLVATVSLSKGGCKSPARSSGVAQIQLIQAIAHGIRNPQGTSGEAATLSDCGQNFHFGTQVTK